MKEENRKRLFRGVKILLFAVYLAMLCYFLFFAESMGRTFSERTYHYNLELLKEIKRFWNYRDSLGVWSVGLNLIGNVVAFLPFGAFLPTLFYRCRRFLPTVLLSFDFSLCVELIQLFWKVGSFDVDDIVLNTLGGMLGYLLYWVISVFVRKEREPLTGGKDEKKSL